MASNTPVKTYEVRNDQRKSSNVDSVHHGVEDVTIIWMNPYMNDIEAQQDVEKTKNSLRKINDYCLFFIELEKCLQYIKSVAKEKIFLITSGSCAVELLDKVHSMKQIDSVFIFCLYIDKYLPLKEKYPKLIDVFTEQDDLIESISNNVKSVIEQTAVFGLFDGKERSTRYLKRESASFLWFQLLTDVLKTISLTDIKNAGIDEMLAHCQIYYRNNRVELNNIEEFRKKYVSLF
jgi:hypothetical protein